MENLKKHSIHIPGTIVVRWPQYNDDGGILDVTSTSSKFDDAYCVNNSTICYVTGHEVYVTPCTKEAIATIKAAGLTHEHFYVPFSNGDYPRDQKVKWEQLLSDARESYYRDYENDCIAYCDKHRIKPLSEEIMERCFRIPRQGVPVKHPYYEDVVRPICGDEIIMDSTVTDKLGRFCANNGRVVFVYRDGHTYVTRGYKILDDLKAAGYKEAGLFVPFSNGETITDPYLASKWDQICKK